MAEASGRNDDICDVPGILVGHDTLLDAATGCTVVVCEGAALGAVDVRGGAPGTRETDLLDPRCMMQEVHAILLAGGSAFGLDAATGVMRVLEARGVGFDVGVARVPIVPAAVLFDLGVGRNDVRPDAASGARATEAALNMQAGVPLALGSVGAGTGATVGKMGGPQFAVKGGIGSASETTPEGYIVGALVAVNAVGDVYDPQTGRIVAGARSPSGQGWLGWDDLAAQRNSPPLPDAPIFPGAQTTIGVIATDAPFSKAELSKLAQMAHDGLALAIRPTHTPLDGDTLFALRTSHASTQMPANVTLSLAMIGAAATQAVARAIIKAVRAATSLAGVPALRDLPYAR